MRYDLRAGCKKTVVLQIGSMVHVVIYVYTAANFAIGQSLFVWDPLEINCHTIKTTH